MQSWRVTCSGYRAAYTAATRLPHDAPVNATGSVGESCPASAVASFSPKIRVGNPESVDKKFGLGHSAREVVLAISVVVHVMPLVNGGTAGE
jgi:hypothetical protein